MKSLSMLALLGSLFTVTAFACGGGVYIGKLEDANKLVPKQLKCSYNGEKSEGTLFVSVPRCLNSRPRVTLDAFGETLDVMNLEVTLIRGIVKYEYMVKIDTVQADGKIVCRTDK